MMTSRQRVMAAFGHREPDRTPIFEYVLLSPVADAILTRPFADGDYFGHLVRENGWDRALRQRAWDLVSLARILGHDMMYVYPVSLPAGTPIPPDASADDPVEEMARRLDRGSETVEESAGPDVFLIYPFVREAMARMELDLPIVAPAYVHGVWTDTALMQTMVLDEDLARRHFARATERAMRSIDRCLAYDIDVFGVGGDFAGNRGPVISPASYRKFIVPEVRRLADHIHAAGRLAVNASDGNLWPVIDDFLIGCGVDGYLEIDFHAGMDLGRLKARFGRQITFLGNLDCGTILSFGSPREIAAHTLDCLEKGRGGGGHILTCSNAITASVPVASYLVIQDAYRKHFGIGTSG